jgi:GNAT superfamily N-acetyltransferase
MLDDQELDQIITLVIKLNSHLSETVIKERFYEIKKTNYQCVGAILDDELIGICGLWSGVKFWCGKYLEIDNFYLKEDFRSQGFGQKILDWIEDYAKEKEFDTIMFDAYVNNYRSHKFYMKNNYEILGYHFTKRII